MSLSTLTVWRTALTPAVIRADDEEHHEQTQHAEAAIIAEIAERLDELEELRAGLSADLVLQLGALANDSRKVFGYAIQLLHGRTDTLLASYQEQADKRGVTKQDIHWEWNNELARIHRHFPSLEVVIRQIRSQAMRHEDPIARSDAIITACSGGSDTL